MKLILFFCLILTINTTAMEPRKSLNRLDKSVSQNWKKQIISDQKLKKKKLEIRASLRKLSQDYENPYSKIMLDDLARSIFLKLPIGTMIFQELKEITLDPSDLIVQAIVLQSIEFDKEQQTITKVN